MSSLGGWVVPFALIVVLFLVAHAQAHRELEIGFPQSSSPSGRRIRRWVRIVLICPWLAIQTGFAGSLVGVAHLLETTLSSGSQDLAAALYAGGLGEVIETTMAGLVIAALLRSAYITGSLVSLVEEWIDTPVYLGESVPPEVTEEIPTEFPLLLGHLDEVSS